MVSGSDSDDFLADDDDFMQEDDGSAAGADGGHDDDYGFEYEDDEDDEPEVDQENRYYNAKGRIEDDANGALDEFQAVVEGDSGMAGNWQFKALKQMVKLTVRLQRFDEALRLYRQLLDMCADPAAVITRNYCEKSINNLLELASSAVLNGPPSTPTSSAPDVSSAQLLFLESYYQHTLDCVARQLKNDRLLVKTHLKLAKLWLDRQDFWHLKQSIRELRALCGGDNDGQSSAAHALSSASADFQHKGTHLLEIYALEIQMYTATKNTKKLKELYQQCLHVKSAIPHPRIMGVIRECGGKMHMAEKEWACAQQDFFEAFKSYDEAGSPQRIQCLKYLVLSNMLAESGVNPFDSQETKSYANDPRISVMTDLVSAYQQKEIRRFEQIIFEHEHEIMADQFIRLYIEDVLQTVRTQLLLQMIRPYRRVRLQHIASSLGRGISCSQVQELLVILILDGKVLGRIDQVSEVLEVRSTELDSTVRPQVAGKRDQYHATAAWTREMAADCDVQMARMVLL